MTSKANSNVNGKINEKHEENTFHQELEIEDVVGILGYFGVFIVYIGFGTLLAIGYLHEFQERLKIFLGLMKDPLASEKGYAPLYKRVDYFWLNHMYQAIRDIFSRPIASIPGPRIQIMERVSYDRNRTFQ